MDLLYKHGTNQVTSRAVKTTAEILDGMVKSVDSIRLNNYLDIPEPVRAEFIESHNDVRIVAELLHDVAGAMGQASELGHVGVTLKLAIEPFGGKVLPFPQKFEPAKTSVEPTDSLDKRFEFEEAFNKLSELLARIEGPRKIN